jgi:hypothetical protein
MVFFMVDLSEDAMGVEDALGVECAGFGVAGVVI